MSKNSEYKMQLSLAKKFFAVGTSAAMLLAAVPFVASAAVHSAGTNVVSNGTVYFVNSSGQKQPYTSAGAFLSYGFNSWSNVQAASAEDLALPTGAFVPPADGSLINDHGTVYLITNGQRAGFTSASVFTGLGYSWSNVIPGDTSFMTNASLISTTSMAHPAGTLVNQSGTVYLMAADGKQGIPSLSVFNSWGYSFSQVVPANSFDNAVSMSKGVMPAMVAGCLSPLNCNGSVVINPTSGPLSVSLSSTTPASGTVVAGSAATDLADFVLSGNATVTGLTFKRLGVSADTTLSNVYLFNGNTRLTDAASVSNGTVNFTSASGLFTVNGSMNLSVRSDIATGTSGQTVGVELTSYTTSGSSAVTTALSGNLFTVASATTLATVSLGTVTPSAANIDTANDTNVWQSTFTIGNRDVNLTRIAFQQIGSINSSNISNFRLYVDGTQVAQVQNLDSNGYVTFAPSTPVDLATGARVVKVLADINGGSTRTVELSLRNASDIGLVDSSYGVNVSATITGGFPASAGIQTINSGVMTVQKATNSPSGNVTLNGSGVALGDWTLTATGEPIKVQTLTVGYTYTSAGANAAATLRNGALFVNGSQVGSTTTLTSTGTQFTTNFVVNPGSPATVELRADIYDNDGTGALAAGDTIQTQLNTGASNATPQVSLTPVNVPSSNVTANTVTVASGSMTLAALASYPSQNTSVPQNAYKLAAFSLTGSSTEDINVNTLQVDFGGTAAASALSNVYVKFGANQTPAKATVSASGNTWSVNYTLAKNSSIEVDVYGSISSAPTAGQTYIPKLLVSGTTAQSGQSVNTNSNAVLAGQTITAATGSLSVAVDASAPVAAITYDNQTVPLAAYKFTTTNDSYTITQLTLTLANASTVQSVSVRNADGSTTYASILGGTTLTVSGLNIPVALNSSAVVTVYGQLGAVGVGAGTSGSSVQATLTGYQANNSQGVQTSVTGQSYAGNNIYVYAGVPTLTASTLASTVLLPGNNIPLSKVTVAANGGTISWDKIQYTISGTIAGRTIGTDDTTPSTLAVTGINAGATTADTASINGFTLVDENNNTIAGTFAIVNNANNATVTFTPTAEQQLSGSHTYTLEGNVLVTPTTGDTVQTAVKNPTTTFAAEVAAGSAAGSFVWSDVSASGHSTTTTDWSGDYLVKNLQITQALSK